MHFTTLLPLAASFTVALSAKAVLSVRVPRGIDGEAAKNKPIDRWREQSLRQASFDGDQQAILQKWQRKFAGNWYEEDSLIAA